MKHRKMTNTKDKVYLLLLSVLIKSSTNVKCYKMSLSDAFLDVQNTSTEEIVAVIKNDEFFSSCCKIIEEKELNGQDILNLNENQILAWKPPPWLVRKLLSLKSTLSKNLENRKQNFPSKFDIEKKYLSLGSSQLESEAFYDDDNYLKPTALNASIKRKIGYGKPLPKLPPSSDSNSSKYRKDRNKSPSAFREPIPSPREDTEENVYEPAPNTSAITNKPVRSYSASNGTEAEDNVYETPPILPQKYHQENTAKFYSNFSLSNSRNVDYLERNYSNIEIKREFSPPLPQRTMSKQKATIIDNHNRKNPPYMNVVNQLSEENFMHKNPSFSDGNEVIMKNFSRSSPKTNDSNMKHPEVSKGDRSGISGRPLPPLPRRNSMQESRMPMNEKHMLHEEKKSGEDLKFYSLRKTSFPTEILDKSDNPDESLMLLQSNILQQLRTSNIAAFQHDGGKNNDDWNSNTDKHNEPLLEQNGSYDEMKSLNESSETKLNTNFLTEIKKVKLRTTKYSLQKDKNTNDVGDKTPSTLANNEDRTKHFESSQSQKPLIKLMSSKLNTSPISNETKFKSTKSRVIPNRNFVGNSAGETETLLENKQKQTNIFNTKLNPNKLKTIVAIGGNFPKDEDLPNYINTTESKKVVMPNTHGQMFSKNISEGENKGSTQHSHTENTKKNFESNLSLPKATSQKSSQPIFNSLANRIAAVKLKPTTPQIQKKQIFVNHDDEEEILPEYINGQELKQSKTNPVTSTTLNKAVKNSNQPWAREINSITPKPQLKQTDLETDQNEVSDDENDDEDQPEYGNTVEIKKFAKQPSAVTQKSSSILEHETTSQSPISQLISELSKKTLKPSNYIQSLDDDAAEILKQKLLERKKGNTNDKKETFKYSSKPPVKLALPPTTLPTTFSNEYLQNTTQENFEDEFQNDYDEFEGVYNLNNEKYYRNTDRKGAEQLLKGLENGAFVLRPSSTKGFFLSITVKTEYKCYNLGIKQTKTNHIFCGEGNTRSPDFYSIKAFLEYYERFPFSLQGENGVKYVYLKKVLPDDRF